MIINKEIDNIIKKRLNLLKNNSIIGQLLKYHFNILI
jgi:hypothetical protein